MMAGFGESRWQSSVYLATGPKVVCTVMVPHGENQTGVGCKISFLGGNRRPKEDCKYLLANGTMVQLRPKPVQRTNSL